MRQQGDSVAKDCRHFVGCAPQTFMKRRQAGLASAWLRCGRRVEDIAQVLGFPGFCASDSNR